MSLTMLAPPAEEPVSLAGMKAHLRVLHDDEDALIGAAITAARRAVEARGGLALIEQGWRLAFDRAPPAPVTLPVGPVFSVDAVTVLDAAGGEALLAPGDYEAAPGTAGRIALTGLAPRPGRRLGGLRIDFTAGWPSPEAVPEELKLAVKLLAAFFFEAREAASPERVFTTPQAADALIAPWRRVRL